MVFNKQSSATRSSASEAIIDQGLRSYMLKVYNYMGSALALTGFIALFTFKFAAIIGPNGDFSALPDISKWILTVGMILGRLEFFAI